MWIAIRGHADAVNLLLEHNAQVNLQNEVSSQSRYSIFTYDPTDFTVGWIFCSDDGVSQWSFSSGRYAAEVWCAFGARNCCKCPRTFVVWITEPLIKHLYIVSL